MSHPASIRFAVASTKAANVKPNTERVDAQAGSPGGIQLIPKRSKLVANLVKKSSVSAALLAAAFLSVPMVAHATPVTWTLSGVTFDDGGIASGSFDFDADLGNYSNVALTTTAGGKFETNSFYARPGRGLSATYLAAGTGCGSDCRLTFWLTFASELTNAGGTSSFSADSGEFYAFDDGWTPKAMARSINTGEVSAQVTAVPEPASYALMLAGLAAVGFTRRRRSAK